jgi:3-oxoadipate enol-lactonase
MTATTNGIDIHYTLEGEGPLVTMSHSLGCNLRMWDEQARTLRQRYRVLRLDTRGHGQTSAPTGAYTLEQLAGDLHGLLTELGIAQTHFLGLSMGGMIGQVFALNYPYMVQSLVLCDTTSRVPPEASSSWEERIRRADDRKLVYETVSRAAPRCDRQSACDAAFYPAAGIHRLLPCDSQT